MSDARHSCASPTRSRCSSATPSIEQLRLGERLRITWELDGAPADALLPPLVLQPLLENAVYHGVEPGTGTADVLVRIERRGDRVLARIENPYLGEPERSAPATAWRWRTSASACAVLRRRGAHRDKAIADGRYRVEHRDPL